MRPIATPPPKEMPIELDYDDEFRRHENMLEPLMRRVRPPRRRRAVVYYCRLMGILLLSMLL